MTPELRRRAKTLFHAALDEDAPARRAFVRARAAGDTALETAVLELLDAHASAGDFLGRPTLGADVAGAGDAAQLAGEERAGDVIGRYRLVAPLGRGGFGVVWRAEQFEPVRREVALKVLKIGMDTRAVVARFEAERQALARMDHTSIARVFDGGSTDRGRPYFVMELVAGRPITDYCTAEGLSTEERLRLFVVVCRAVQHAHQKGVVHRDLKPGNVLVATQQGVPLPKVIDFGIAKATADVPEDGAQVTEARAVLGTPQYMAPEQAAGSGVDVDTRADVYSLGVILYELLTGETPFDARLVREASWDQVVRTIREVDPARPSTRVSTRAGAQPDATRALVKRLRGDVDWIVMKALAKDRAERYETAGALADDVERHLAHLPVMAGPPSHAYVLAKAVRRHRVAFAAATAVLLAILIGAGAALYGLVEAREQRRRAEEREQTARAALATSTRVSDFLSDMLRGVRPSVAQGRDTTILREILTRTQRSVDEELARDPAVRAPLLDVLGVVARELGDTADAVKHHEESLALRRAFPPGDERATAACAADLAAALRADGRARDALAPVDEALALLARAEAGDERLRAQVLDIRGTVQVDLGAFDEAERDFTESLRIQRALGAARSPEDRTALNNLGELARRRGRFADARAAWDEFLEVVRATEGPDHPYAILVENNLAALSSDEGEPARARQRFEEILERCRKVHGANGPETLLTLENLGNACQRLGDHAGAVRAYEDVRAAHAASGRPATAEIARVAIRLGHSLLALKRRDEARERLDEGLATFERLGVENRAEMAEALSDRASLRASPAEDAAIEADLVRAAAIACAAEPGSRTCGVHENELGGFYLDRGRVEEAAVRVARAVDAFRADPACTPADRWVALGNLAMLRVRLGDRAGALAPARESYDLRRAGKASADEIDDAATWLVLALAATGAGDEADRVLREALDTRLAQGAKSNAAKRAAHRNAAIRCLIAGRLELGRTFTDAALEFDRDPRKRDVAEHLGTLGVRHTIETRTGHPEVGVALVREALDVARARPSDATTIAGMEIFLGTALIDVLAVRPDASLAAETVALVEHGFETRRPLIPATDWRMSYARVALACARGELERATPLDATADAGARAARLERLRGLQREIAELLPPLVAGGFPAPGSTLRLPTVLESAARIDDMLHAAEPDAGHEARARAWRASAEDVRTSPPR